MKKDISVIIQGPLDNQTYEAIDSYTDQGFDEIIVSTWEDSNLTYLEKTKNDYKLIVSEYNLDNHNYNNEGYRYFQSVTINEACKKATNKYCLKTRTDELYPNLDRMISNLNDYPERIHTTNNGFWTFESKKIPACFSSHLYIAPTQQLLEASKNAIDNCMGANFSHLNFICTEQLYGYFLMLSRGFDLTKEDWKTVLRNNIFITPCGELPGHLHSGCTFLRNYLSHKRLTNYPYDRPDGHHPSQLYFHHEQIA